MIEVLKEAEARYGVWLVSVDGDDVVLKLGPEEARYTLPELIREKDGAATEGDRRLYMAVIAAVMRVQRANRQ
jgi:hypothetical protein